MLDKHYTDFGVKNSRFYVDYRPCSRPVDNLRVESERYARELSATGQHNILGLSTGLDSQVVLHSFLSQGLPLESAFLYFPTFNEVEFKQLQILEKNLRGQQTLTPQEIFYLASAAEILLDLCDKYGKK